MRKLSWILYVVGLVLIAGSWLHVVPYALGWCGWIVGMVGWAMFRADRVRRPALTGGQPRKDAVTALDTLARLHKEGALTDCEFSKEKQRLLRDE